jgi:YD repeat-containing protein
MHSSRILFALHNLVLRAYKKVNRRCGKDRRISEYFDEETTMNPIRIAKNWISYRRTMNELGNLSSQTLNDIGITRYEIRNIASRSFR